jgi:hypothetical protein
VPQFALQQQLRFLGQLAMVAVLASQALAPLVLRWVGGCGGFVNLPVKLQQALLAPAAWFLVPGCALEWFVVSVGAGVPRSVADVFFAVVVVAAGLKQFAVVAAARSAFYITAAFAEVADQTGVAAVVVAVVAVVVAVVVVAVVAVVAAVVAAVTTVAVGVVVTVIAAVAEARHPVVGASAVSTVASAGSVAEEEATAVVAVAAAEVAAVVAAQDFAAGKAFVVR